MTQQKSKKSIYGKLLTLGKTVKYVSIDNLCKKKKHGVILPCFFCCKYYLLNALFEFVSAGIDFNFVACLNEVCNTDFIASTS